MSKQWTIAIAMVTVTGCAVDDTETMEADAGADDSAYSDLTYPPPTCSLSINPTIGDRSTVFQVSVATSYATSCPWSIDNGPMTSGPCRGPMALGPFAGGPHRVEVFPSGPGGYGHCVLWWTVTTPIPAPTARVTISPTTGSTQTPFTFTLSSTNATRCYYALDSSGWIPVECNLTHTAAGFAVGTHRVWMRADGPEQSAIVDSAFTVTAAPTCSITATPTSGTSATTFTFGLDSTGASSCSYQLDGSTWAPVPCTYRTSAAGFAPGTHVLNVRAVSPTGTGTCTRSIQVQ